MPRKAEIKTRTTDQVKADATSVYEERPDFETYSGDGYELDIFECFDGTCECCGYPRDTKRILYSLMPSRFLHAPS